MTNEQLVRELVDAAYASGYLCGKKEDGSLHHEAVIKRRESLRDRVLARMNIVVLQELLSDYEIVARAVGYEPEDFELIRRIRAVVAEAQGGTE